MLPRPPYGLKVEEIRSEKKRHQAGEDGEPLRGVHHSRGWDEREGQRAAGRQVDTVVVTEEKRRHDTDGQATVRAVRGSRTLWRNSRNPPA
jgi:hypothetical protein